MVLLTACGHHSRAPIEQKSARPEVPVISPARPAATPRVATGGTVPASYRVVKGDTLHAIAWRYRLDYRDLVRWNKLTNPDLIVIGQRLRLTAPPAPKASSATRPSATRVDPPRAAPAAPARAPSAATEAVHTALQWSWPATGKVSVARTASGTRGIEIRGQQGQPVMAASSGAVVYSGSGLRGYGELIIIKHNETFLSAYAHNEARLVEEGQRVKPGQMIARMGDSEAREVMLHFEIRRNGKPVDPFQYLPRR